MKSESRGDNKSRYNPDKNPYRENKKINYNKKYNDRKDTKWCY